MWSWLRRALSRLRFVSARRRYDADAAAELEIHVAMLTERYERAGLAPGEARTAARRQLGNPTQVREEIYRMNSIGWLDALGKDLRYAVRMVTRNPGFAAVAITTLALGIGANTAMVSVAYAVLLKPLPYAHPDEIHSAQIVIPERRAQFASIPASIQTFNAWRSAPTVLTDIAALRPWECTLTGDGEPERVGGARVSTNFFSLLGVPVAHGRGFSREEEQPGRERVVVISDALVAAALRRGSAARRTVDHHQRRSPRCRRYRAAVVAGADRLAPARAAAIRAARRHLEADRAHTGRARRRELGPRRAGAGAGTRRASSRPGSSSRRRCRH